MRSNPSDFNIIQPDNLNDTLNLLAKDPDKWKVFAGGTDLMVLFESGKLDHKNYINIWEHNEFKEINVTEEFLEIGCLVSYSEIRNHPIIIKEFPALFEAAKLTGAIAIQNRGTLGGNIANVSPAADSPPGLLAYGAELELVSQNGQRWVDYANFHSGYKVMDLKKEELISKIRLLRKNRKHFFRKIGTRKAQAISKVVFAGSANLENGIFKEVNIGIGSVAAVPFKAKACEQAIIGNKLSEELIEKAQIALKNEINPIDDVRSTGEYRLQVCLNLLKEFLSHVGLDS